MTKPFTDQRLHEIVEDLRGTSKSLPSALQVGEDENSHQLASFIDDYLFECECCGWWCGWDEQAADQDIGDEPRCDECGPND